MLIRFGFEISIFSQPNVPMLLALSPHPDFAGRIIGDDSIKMSAGVSSEEYRDRFNNRITRIIAPQGPMTLSADCIAEIDGLPDPVLPDTTQTPIERLPPETLSFVTASRYCDSDELGDFAWQQFGATPMGWPRVQAIVDYVHNETTFGYKFGRPTKTAVDVFNEKTGVCRDFAHLSVALCRAMNIPARYCSGYVSEVGHPTAAPGDFCAWFEVFLDGAWHTFDARYNVPRTGRILMVRGSDATDVAMITSFGAYDLTWFEVWTQELPEGLSDEEALGWLGPDRPSKVDETIFSSSGRAS